MLVKLILLFTIIPITELIILMKLGTLIGIAKTLLIVIGTGILGAVLAKMQGVQILYKITNEINRGAVPAGYLFDGFLIFIAGVVLITPGLITDILGFLLLIPFTRAIIKSWLSNTVRNKIKKGDLHISFFGDREE